VPQIHTPNATRWNSKYEMIRSIIDAEQRCDGIFKQVAELISCSCLSAAELATLSELRDLLAPFAAATKNLETEENPTSGMVIPTVIGIEKALSRQQPRFVTSVKTGLLVSLQKRAQMVFDNEHYTISTVLDPRYKLKWVTNAEDTKKVCETVRSQYDVHPGLDKRGQNQGGGDDEGSGTAPTNSDGESEVNLYSFLDEASPSSSDELDTYLGSPFSSDSTVAKFWTDHKATLPILYKLQQRHLLIPATSSSIERSFSSAGLILSDRRSRLNDDMFEEILVTKLNADLMAQK